MDFAGVRTYDSIARATSRLRLTRITVITQRYHAYRAEFIGKKCGCEIVAYAAPATMITPIRNSCASGFRGSRPFLISTYWRRSRSFWGAGAGFSCRAVEGWLASRVSSKLVLPRANPQHSAFTSHRHSAHAGNPGAIAIEPAQNWITRFRG